jgi:hypothetical protein
MKKISILLLMVIVLLLVVGCSSPSSSEIAASFLGPEEDNLDAYDSRGEFLLANDAKFCERTERILINFYESMGKARDDALNADFWDNPDKVRDLLHGLEKSIEDLKELTPVTKTGQEYLAKSIVVFDLVLLANITAAEGDFESSLETMTEATVLVKELEEWEKSK